MSSNERIAVFGPALPLNLAPMWLAHDKGFFKEEGLDVELRPVQGIPDSQHPRHQWRKEGMIIFQSPGGSPPFRSVLENRDHIDGEVNVVSIANRTAHVFVAKPYVKDIPDLKGKKNRRRS
jgi:ABC-type nitrate/sulfonate/bicarbonate transport system substrate-binding protein